MATSVVITTNLSFSEWGAVFGDARMTTALLDRPAHLCHILETGNGSFRFKANGLHFPYVCRPLYAPTAMGIDPAISLLRLTSGKSVSLVTRPEYCRLPAVAPIKGACEIHLHNKAAACMSRPHYASVEGDLKWSICWNPA